MNCLLFYALHPYASLAFIFIIGAMIGSFLNVVIYRYPIMLEREWNRDCAIQLNLPLPEKSPTFTLSLPRSHCPHCKQKLPFWLNIPLLSYLLLLGKCRQCREPISSRYVWVELLSALLSIIVVAKFGLCLKSAALLLFTYTVIALSFIDLKHQFLPDTMTLSLLWIGLALSINHIFISSVDAILGALFGYLFLWAIAKGYYLLRKKEGMGLGDCKMLAMIGAWVGPFALIHVLLISTMLALLMSFIFIVLNKFQYDNPIPFGPFIGVAGWIVLILGDRFFSLFAWM